MFEETNLYGLAFSCPAQKRQPDCPFKQVEHLSFLEKVKWINTLSDEEKETILERHQICSKNR